MMRLMILMLMKTMTMTSVMKSYHIGISFQSIEIAGGRGEGQFQ